MRLALFAMICLFMPAVAAASAPAGSEQTCAPATAGEPRVFATELAGVPARIRVPARIAAPPIVLWHGFGPPAGEEALMSLLPLDEVPAVKVYLGLPMFGARAPADPGEVARRQAEDLATGVFEPVVMGAAHELPRVLDALRRKGCLQRGQAIGLFGFSAGGAATLYALAEREVPVQAAVVLSASTGLSASVAAYERALGKTFAWTPRARALARRSDAVVRAADIAAGTPPPALLIVHGAQDTMLDDKGVHALHRALVPHYAAAPDRLQLSIVEDLPHAIRTAEDAASAIPRRGRPAWARARAPGTARRCPSRRSCAAAGCGRLPGP